MFLTLVALFSAFQVKQPEIATAASSSNLNFQARLLTSSGNTVPDGYYNIEFNLYNVSSGGSSLWTETYYDSNGVTAGNDNRLRVVNGYLSANLGSLTAFPTTINWDQEHWITMNIGGSAQTATPTYDGEMSPRLKLTAVPYAFKAGELAKTTGGNVSTLKFDTQTAANNILLPDEAGTLCIRSSVNCGFAASSGSANYIQNGTTGQTANFNIQSAANTSVVGVLQGAASQSADLLQFKDSSGTILTAFDSAGRLVFGPAGSQDTNLYRSAANTLKTDDALEVVGTLAVTGTQTFTGGGTFNGGLTVANNSNFSQTGSGTFGTGTGAVSLNGNTSVTGSNSFTVGTGTTTLGGNVVVNGSEFNNTGSTLNSALALGDLAAGSIGSAGTTVDIKTNFTISPTAGGRTYTIPNPTTATAGRIIYIQNINGSNSFMIGSTTFSPGSTSSYVWDGTAWRIVGAAAGVTTIGVIDGGTPNANGATISGTTLYLQTADATYPGLISATTQTIAGAKTFTGAATFSSAGTALTVTNDASIGGTGTIGTLSVTNGATIGTGLTVTSGGATITAGGLTVTAGGAGITGVTNINTTGANATTIGNAGATVALNGSTNTITGTTNINTTGTANTSIGNATGTLALTSSTFNLSTGGAISGVTDYAQASGNFLQSGTGTFGTGTGAVSLNGATSVTGSNAFNVGTGTSTFAGGNITQTGSGTFSTGTGSVSLNGDTTISSGKDLTITGGTGSQFTNNSSTLNSALALGDLAAGALGVNTATVDIKTSFTIAPTVAGRTYTIPTPSDVTAGRIIYISNVHGSNNFIIGSATFNAGTTGSFVWDGNGWRAAGIDTGVTTVGALNGGTANSTGATITGTTIYLQSASYTNPGVVDTGTQVFTGDKTIRSTSNSATAFSVQNSSSQSLFTVDTLNAGLSVGNAGLAGTIQIGNTTGAVAQTINIGNNATGSSTSTVVIGSTIGTSPVTIQSGTSGITANSTATTGTALGLSANALTTGTGFSVTSSSGNYISGNLANISQTATFTTAGISQTSSVINSSRTITANMSGTPTVTLDATTNGGSSASTTATWNHTIGNYTNRALVVAVGNWISNPSGNPTCTVTYGGISMTQYERRVNTSGSYTYTSFIYGLTAPAIGTASVSVSCSAGNTTVGESSSWYNVDQTTSFAGATGTTNGASPISLTVSGTTTNDKVVDSFWGGGTVLTPGAGQTAYGSYSGLAYASYKNGATTSTGVSYSQNSATQNAYTAMAVKAAAAASAGVTGAVQSISSNCVVSAGGCIDSANILSINQQYATSTGVALRIQNAGSGGAILAQSGSVNALTVQNAAGTATNFNVDTTNGIVSLGSTTYSTGSIAQSTTTITGTGTTFTTDMTGGRIYYADGTSSTVTYVSGTSLTSSVSKTVPAGTTYRLVYGGLNTASGGVTTLQTTTNNASAFQVQNAARTAIFNVDTTNGRIGINTSAPSADLTFGDGATRTINVQTRTSNAAGSALTISAGAAGSGASAFAGGALTLQGGAAGGTGNANGGAVTIAGGAAVGTGTQGLVNLSTSAFTSAAEQAFTSSTSITAGNVDLYSSLPVKANTNTGSVLTIPDPAQATIGRLLYVSARSGSLDFTMRLNSARTPIDIAMKQNSTATLIWNGTDWTAAGASSSTDLQSAYNNTLTSAGGAELVLNAPGGNADGLTIRNNATTPITGGILEVQTSIGSNLFSVNNNATEYATNGGAETQGASSSTFPASTWIAAPAGGTVSRNTSSANNATGTASVSVVTTTTSHGAADTLSAALTANLQYTVSFTAKGATNFSTLDVIYSRDGTNTSTTTCTTGKTVTTSIWSRITCTFTAPSSGISSLNAIFIRQSDATGRTFYIDNLSVNVNASVNHAADGSVDSALGTNWTDFGTNGSGTTTVARNTSIIYDTSGSVEKTTGATATKGIRNNMPITPSVSTQYLVTFYARSSNTFTDITAGFLPAGGDSAPAAAQLCTDYNTQSVSTSGWTKVTCIITTPSSGISDPDVVIYQPTGTARTFYVDALTVTLNTNTASNVQVGQGNKGGPTTLFTLDRSSTAPIADNNDAYLGSMYYDTTSGRIQCYEADGWGACGAAPDNIVNLNPEFAGAVLNGSGVGTMSADFCGNGGGLSVNTGLCTSGQARNFYKWTSPQASEQIYSIYVTYQLPASFKNFASDDTVQLTARTSNTTDGFVTYEMFRNESGSISACGTETTVTTTVDTWQTVGVNGNESTSCSFTTSSANAFVIFKINVKAKNNANVYVGTLSFTTAGR